MFYRGKVVTAWEIGQARPGLLNGTQEGMDIKMGKESHNHKEVKNKGWKS